MMEVEYQRWVSSVPRALTVLEAHTEPEAVLKAFVSQPAKISFCQPSASSKSVNFSQPLMRSLSQCHRRLTNEEARAEGKLKPFDSSGNESPKYGLWSWWKLIEISWQRKGAESASLRDLKGTTEAHHRTPRRYWDVLGKGCNMQLQSEQHKRV